MAQQFAAIMVKVEGMDLFRQRLDSRRLLRPTRDYIEQVGKAAHRTAQRAAKPHAADKGTLGRYITVEISDGGKTATVAPIRRIVGVAQTIEEGRRPGRRPPYTPIKRWMLSHGLISGAPGESNLVRVMQGRIKSVGTKGVYFMRTASEAAEKALKDGLPETEEQIRKLWDRP